MQCRDAYIINVVASIVLLLDEKKMLKPMLFGADEQKVCDNLLPIHNGNARETVDTLRNVHIPIEARICRQAQGILVQTPIIKYDQVAMIKNCYKEIAEMVHRPPR